MYPAPPRSYKGVYPFKLGSTSFIYPDHIIPNVKILGRYLDEIELLLFESTPDSLPSKEEITTLATLATELDLTYNIHLPTDISPGDTNPSLRCHAVDTIKRIIDFTSPLPTSTRTLHLSYDEPSNEKTSVKKWQELIYKSMEQLISSGISGKVLSIETLSYPFEWVENIITAFNLSVCMDIGHLILQNTDLETFFGRYSDIISIIHLHGVKNHHDHLPLDKLPEKEIGPVCRILKQFSGVVSLEVFSYKDLTASLQFLKTFRQ